MTSYKLGRIEKTGGLTQGQANAPSAFERSREREERERERGRERERERERERGREREGERIERKNEEKNKSRRSVFFSSSASSFSFIHFLEPLPKGKRTPSLFFTTCFPPPSFLLITMPRDMTGCGRYPPQPKHKPLEFYSAVRLGDAVALEEVMKVDPYFITQDNGAGAPVHFAATCKQLDMV